MHAEPRCDRGRGARRGDRRDRRHRHRPTIEGDSEGHVVEAWQAIRDEVNIGQRVVIADWRCDWVGLGLAEKLARSGCWVRLAVNGIMAGRDHPVRYP